MLYHWLGWISFVLCIILLLKYIGRISNIKNFNNKLRIVHKPIGIIVIGISALHGILSIIKSYFVIIPNITGIILWLIIVALSWSFYVKKKLKAKWLILHRYLSIVLIIVMIIHVVVSII